VRAAVAGSLLTVLAGLAVSGCSSDTTATTELPTCADAEHGNASNAVVLMAQSVPTASYVPCLRTALPLGWGFHHLDARSDGSVFSLDSDRDGQEAIKVRLDESCDTSGSTEILSDREGLQRFERVTRTTPHFEGERYYRFDGGCITFEFRLAGESRGEGLALATSAVGVISRADLIEQVHEDSDGRLSLDPPPAADGEP
jgi:hypothetical protein